MTWTDEIVAEVRRAREVYVATQNDDLQIIYHDLQAKEQASGRTVVSFPPKRPTRSTTDNADAA